MKSNPLLEEIWEIRRELDRQAGGDIATHIAQTNEWLESQSFPGPVLDPEELPAYFAKIEAERAERAGLETVPAGR